MISQVDVTLGASVPKSTFSAPAGSTGLANHFAEKAFRWYPPFTLFPPLAHRVALHRLRKKPQYAQDDRLYDIAPPAGQSGMAGTSSHHRNGKALASPAARPPAQLHVNAPKRGSSVVMRRVAA